MSGDDKQNYKFVVQLYPFEDINKGLDELDPESSDYERQYEKVLRQNMDEASPAVSCSTEKVVDPDKDRVILTEHFFRF